MTPITLSRQRHGMLADCLADRAPPRARSRRFTVYDIDAGRAADPRSFDPFDVILVHDFDPSEIDNNIGRYVADELLPLLSLHGAGGRSNPQALFERFVGEIVRSMHGDERHAWHLFYDNTLDRLHEAAQRPDGANGQDAGDFVADFAAIYRQAAGLAAAVAPATLLDVATCFGFFPLGLARTWHAGGPALIGCDCNAALVALAEDYAGVRGRSDIRFVAADIGAATVAQHLARQLAPLSPPFDVVTAIHLLEHLEPAETAPAMAALWSLTARRLVIAVPVEETPDPRFGHRQVFDRARLAALGDRLGGRWQCFDDHGAWLVVDRPGA